MTPSCNLVLTRFVRSNRLPGRLLSAVGVGSLLLAGCRPAAPAASGPVQKAAPAAAVAPAVPAAPVANPTVAEFTVTERYGVAHPDQIIDFDLSKPVDPATCFLVGPDGTEVPYQLLEGGRKLAVRTGLPASRLAMRRGLGNTCEGWARDYKFDKAGVEQCVTTDSGAFVPGEVVRVDGTTLPDGLKRNTDYYVKKLDYRDVQGWGFWFISLATTPDGPAIAIAKPGDNAYLLSRAFVVDPETDLLYAHAHGLRDGVAVRFRTRGELPEPLAADVDYYVRGATADRFGLAATRGGAPLDLVTPGKGIHELLTAWTWTLKSGHASSAGAGADAVQLEEKKDAAAWEITNGRAGVRIPATQVPADAQRVPAPVQGIRLADGTWPAKGPAFIHFTPGTRVKNVTAEFVERGPLKVVVAVTYDLDRALYSYGQTPVCPAGPGKYVCRIEVQAGQPSVLFEEDTDCQFAYDIPLAGLTVNQARYRGHSVRDPKHGYRPDGQPVANRSGDAFFDLPFDRDYASGYVTNLKDGIIRWLQPWDPWIFDSGNYWMLYDKDGADASPLIGFYDGRASRLRQAGAVGVGVYTRGPAPGGPATGITVQAWQRGASGVIYENPRWQWRLFIGRKGTDLADWHEVQPINRQMNLHSGINLNKVYRLSPDFPAPAAPFGAMYMKRDAVDDMVRRLREEPVFHDFAYNTVTYFRDLIDMLCDGSGKRVHQMADDLWRGAHDGLNTLVHGQGIWGYQYWHAGLEGSRALMRIDQVLASDKATDDDRALVREAAVFHAGLLWDDDHAPLAVPAGVNLGTANMPVQQQGYRDMYALYLATHPMMHGRTEGVWERARGMLRGTINENGAHMGCTHYIGAANGPLLSSLQQLKQAKVADAFATEPRLRKYAEFEMNFCTPVDPRFGKRVRPSIGDACPGEATEFLGMLATSFADIDPALSARLMGAWQQSGKPESDFHGATIFKIDERVPAADPQLASTHIEGWYSVLRFGWGTPRETAAWFVNGGFYSDHASHDLGEPVIYALGAPLSLDFGSMYSPHSPGGFVHSVVLPERVIGADWKQNPPDITLGPRWGRAKTEEFKVVDREAWSRAHFELRGLGWTRTVKVAMLRDDLPVIGIRDHFDGEGADQAKVFLLNLMADGAVTTPGGAKNVGDGFAVPAGVTRLGFLGQTFPKHPSQGIDWDLYVVAAEPQEAFLAQWSHKNVCGERQHILRLKGTGEFLVVIVPRVKGAPAPEVTVTAEKGGATVTAGGVTAQF